MSEADSPNDQLAPVPINPSEQVAAVHPADSERLTQAPDEGWQTVDFPGAVSVDALPRSQDALGALTEPGIIHYSSAEIDPSTTSMAAISVESEAVSQVQQLQDENATLRDRLTQVELDLVQQQIERQLESACTLSQAEAATDEVTMPTLPVLGQPPILQLTHDRLHQLLQELERSHQAAQRQQILVETLTEQLESGQERIAQLERDCALTQQRHNEQVQQVLQAESACRDLRLRLHRQQQQTLQFKAALEKCLEMPALYGNQALADVALAESSAAPDALAALLKPKNQPVKPWSLPSPAQPTTSAQLEQPKPLFQQDNETDLLQEDGALVAKLDTPFGNDGQADAMVDPSALLDSDDPQFVTHLMQLIFPAPPEHLSFTTTDDLRADVSQAEAFFDLSPFLEERVNLAAIPSVELSNQAPELPDHTIEPLTTLPETPEANHQAELNAVPSEAGAIAHIPASTPPCDRSTDPLWRDLATLIDLPLSTADPNAATSVTVDSADASVEPLQAATDTTGIPPLFTTPYEAAPAVEIASVEVAGVTPIDATAAPLTTWTWRDRLTSQNAPSSTPIAERTITEPAITEPVAIERAPQSPSKLLALSAGSTQSLVKQQTVSSSQAEPPSTPFAPSTPSPIVYPLRSTKKLASLAAVDLPTFPRR